MDKNKTLNNVKRAINALPLNQAYRDSLNNTFKELVDNSGSGGGNTPSDPSSGGSNDYIFPYFITDTNYRFSIQQFNELKEALTSGRTIKIRTTENIYLTITSGFVDTIVKTGHDAIRLFIDNFDNVSGESLLISVVNTSNGITWGVFNVSDINRHLPYNHFTNTISANINNIGHIFKNESHIARGISLNIFNFDTGERLLKDGIYKVGIDDNQDTGVDVGVIIVYTIGNITKFIGVKTKIDLYENNTRTCEFCIGYNGYFDSSSESMSYGYDDVYVVWMSEYAKGDETIKYIYDNLRQSAQAYNNITTCNFFSGAKPDSFNDFDDIRKELLSNRDAVNKQIENNNEIFIWSLTEGYYDNAGGYSLQIFCHYNYGDYHKKLFKFYDFMNLTTYYILNVIDREFKVPGTYGQVLSHLKVRCIKCKDGDPLIKLVDLSFNESNSISEINQYIYTEEEVKDLSANDVLIIDYSDITEQLPSKYPDITNKPLYITGLWDYTPDNGSLTKRFIPAIYTYNGSGSFTINYKVDISGQYEKKQIVGLIYYDGAGRINHTYHTVCPSYTINLNVQDGTNTGTFDNNTSIYKEVRQTIYGGGQIVIKGDATTNYVEAEAVATDYVVLRWSVPRIGEDDTSVTLSVYELKLTPEDYTTKVVHKTI